MRSRGDQAIAVAAMMLLGIGACRGSDTADVSSPSSAGDVALPKAELKVVPGGAWLLTASFAWRTCGERACWFHDEGRHGGPDVFGVYLSTPPVTVESAQLTLQSSCRHETRLSRSDAVTGEAGAFFLVQERTGTKNSCEDRGAGPDFNMASGTVEAVVRVAAGAPCEGLVSVTSLFGHSYGDTGKDVKVNAGHSTDGRRIDWGGDATHQFQTVGAESGTYDCSGAPK
jgi:hypothetical protein